MTLFVEFEQKSDTCHVAFIKKARISVRGHQFLATEAVRATLETEGWRIDFAGLIAGAWLPWEAINKTSYTDIESAKEAIRVYAASPPEE